MDVNRLPKKILNYKPEGRRNIGRPQTRWKMISGRNRPRGLSLILYNDNDDDDNNNNNNI